MPYKHGFSPESIHHNIALFIREGYPQDQAVAMALDIARKAWRREHPRGKYPAHLRGMRGPRKRRGKRRNRADRRGPQRYSPRGKYGAFAYYRNGRYVDWYGDNYREMMSQADSREPTAWEVVIRTDHTSDGTYHGPGRGRMVAQRESGRWFVDVGDSAPHARAR